MKARVVAAVTVTWLLAALVWGLQTALGGSLRGNPVPLARALTGALVQTVPWIPVTLAVVALSLRFPLGRDTWQRNIWVHLLAVPVVAFAANVLVVLGFWATAGDFGGVSELVEGALLWATLRVHITALIYAAIAAITHSLAYYRRMRDRELRLARLEGQLARARLQALNSQIRPHFLFNTLHTIGQLWRSGRSDDADAMLDHLGALFQKVQSTSGSAEVPFSEEIEMVREYLAIERSRFRDRLRVEISVDDRTLEWPVPPLILQPLVENAIRHGISPTSAAECVEVSATIENGDLVLEVRDDGPGMRDPAPTAGSGTGLSNTRERLEQLYGGDQRLDVLSGPEGGTTVRLVLSRRTEIPDG